MRLGWDTQVFRAGLRVAMTKSSYVENMTAAYIDDPDGFKRDVRAATRDRFLILDENSDCLLDNDELVHILQIFGHNNIFADIRYFNAFSDPDGVESAEFIDAWTYFHTNEDQSAIDTLLDPFSRLAQNHEQDKYSRRSKISFT